MRSDKLQNRIAASQLTQVKHQLQIASVDYNLNKALKGFSHYAIITGNYQASGYNVVVFNQDDQTVYIYKNVQAYYYHYLRNQRRELVININGQAAGEGAFFNYFYNQLTADPPAILLSKAMTRWCIRALTLKQEPQNKPLKIINGSEQQPKALHFLVSYPTYTLLFSNVKQYLKFKGPAQSQGQGAIISGSSKHYIRINAKVNKITAAASDALQVAAAVSKLQKKRPPARVAPRLDTAEPSPSHQLAIRPKVKYSLAINNLALGSSNSLNALLWTMAKIAKKDGDIISLKNNVTNATTRYKYQIQISPWTFGASYKVVRPKRTASVVIKS